MKDVQDGRLEELIRDLMIVELAKAGCTNEEIRKIVMVTNNRVSNIAGPARRAVDRNARRETRSGTA